MQKNPPIKEKRNQSSKKKYNMRPNSKSHKATKDYYQKKGNNQKKNNNGYYDNLVNEILSVPTHFQPLPRHPVEYSNPVDNSKEQINKKQKKPYFSFTLLSALSAKTLNEQIDFFINKADIIERFSETKFTNDMIYKMTTILKEIATSNSEPAIQIISNIVSNTEFFTKIVLPLIKTPLFDDSSYLVFLNDLIVIFTKIFDKFSNLHNLLPINDISPTVDLLLISFAKGIIKYDKQIIDTIKANSEILKQKNLLSLFTKVEDQQRKKENKIEELKNVPIDYYDKSPIITSDELQDKFRLPIQQHRPKGSYESYERYFTLCFI